MKKSLIILLIVGLLVGVCCSAVLGESFDGNVTGENRTPGSTPCGGSSGDGGHPGSTPCGGSSGDGGHPG